jgi:hypothetical protein
MFVIDSDASNHITPHFGNISSLRPSPRSTTLPSSLLVIVPLYHFPQLATWCFSDHFTLIMSLSLQTSFKVFFLFVGSQPTTLVPRSLTHLACLRKTSPPGACLPGMIALVRSTVYPFLPRPPLPSCYFVCPSCRRFLFYLTSPSQSPQPRYPLQVVERFSYHLF